MSLINAALSALDRGWSIVPVRCVEDESKPGKIKKPATVKWLGYRDKRVEKSVVLTQWRNKLTDHNGVGYAVICGEISNLFVVDVDTDEANNMVIDLLPDDFHTKTVRTPSGGYHYYFFHTDGFHNGASIGVAGLDIRTYGGYVVGPGSTYPDGTPYELVEDVEIRMIPQELKQFLLDHQEAPAAGEGPADTGGKSGGGGDWFSEILRTGFIDGQRVDQLKRVIGLLVGEKRDESYIRNMVELINRASEEPLPDAELEEQTASMLRSFIGKEQKFTDELEERICTLNREYAQITIGGKPMIMRFRNGGCDDFDIIQPAAMKTETRHLVEWIGKKKFYLQNLWEESPTRRRYQEIIFDPSDEPQVDYSHGDNGRYNLWRGFTVKPEKGDWSLFRRHIEEVMAPGHGDYVLKWLARMFQDPGGRRPGKVLVFRGKPGTGKSFTRKIIGHFFGRHYYKTDDIQHLIGKFNNAVSNVIFLALEEAMWAGDRSQVGRLKERITSKTISIEKKGIDVITIDSHLNIIMNSNEKWVVPIQDNDRRFVVFDVADTYAQNGEYFRAIEEQMENGGYEAMLYDMLNWEYKWDDLMGSPKTGAGFDQFTRDTNPLKQFALDVLARGTLHRSHKGWTNVIIKEKFYEEYTDFCRNKKIYYVDSFIIFSKDIDQYLPLERGRKRFGAIGKGGKGNTRAITPVFLVPSLEKCREFISQGFDVTWDEPTVEDRLSDSERDKDMIDDYMQGMVEGPF